MKKIIFIVGIFVLGCTYSPGVYVSVKNEDTSKIKVLKIYTNSKEYRIENIKPGKTKGIIIQIKGKTSVSFQADSGKVLGRALTYLASIKKEKSKYL